MGSTCLGMPPWMPPVDTIAVLPVAEWWDIIVAPQTLGLAALEILDLGSDRAPGPVLWEPMGPIPRLQFLVPTGTSDGWSVPHTSALGVACFIGVPGPTTLEPPGIHWLVPPDPDNPEALVDAAALRQALLNPAPAS